MLYSELTNKAALDLQTTPVIQAK